MWMTAPLERAVRVFLEDPAAQRCGYDLMKAAGLASGTLYPLLARLQARGLVASAWETPQHDGERPRRYYHLTGEGIEVARLELAQLSARRRGGPGRGVRPAPADARWEADGTPCAPGSSWSPGRAGGCRPPSGRSGTRGGWAALRGTLSTGTPRPR